MNIFQAGCEGLEMVKRAMVQLSLAEACSFDSNPPASRHDQTSTSRSPRLCDVLQAPKAF